MNRGFTVYDQMKENKERTGAQARGSKVVGRNQD
jgi:hypothetical protein